MSAENFLPPGISLPSPRLFRQACHHNDGWSDHYGALHEAAEYAGQAMPERYAIRAIWTHGCFGPWEATSPGPILFNSPKAGEWPLFVARRELADYLHAAGYARARAIGMPIVYAPPAAVVRRPRTLLVMPTHTLAGAKFPDRAPFERYADEIVALRARFDRVVICLHPACLRNGLWLQEFKARGFEIVIGAQTHDRHALCRMRMLFGQFEFMTTNGWGSHVPYALAHGAKVSIHGTEIVNTDANAMLDLTWSTNLDSLRASKTAEFDRQKCECLAPLFRHPADGKLDVAWGEWFIGADCRLTPAEMRELLPELFVAAPAAVASTAPTAQVRQPVMAHARILAADGQKNEAVRALLGLIQAAIASKDARVILDTLREVTVELQPLDPARAGQLQEQARILAARIAGVAA